MPLRYEKLDFNDYGQIRTAVIHLMLLISFLLGFLWCHGLVGTVAAGSIINSVYIILFIVFTVYIVIMLKFVKTRTQPAEETTVVLEQVRCINKQEI